MKRKIFKFIKQKLIKSSSGLALTYTLGHILIAMSCTYFITGSELELAALMDSGFMLYIDYIDIIIVLKLS